MDLLNLAYLVNPAMIGLDQLGECSPVMNIYIYSKIDWDRGQKLRRMVVLNPLVNLLIILIFKSTCLTQCERSRAFYS